MARCPNCDTKLAIDAPSCPGCAAAFGNGAAWQPVPEDAAEAARARPALRQEVFPDSNTVRAGRLLRLLGWITLAFTLVVGPFTAYLLLALGSGPRLIIMLLGGALVLSALCLVAGAGVKRHRPWARYLALALCVFSLTNFPIGTVIGAMILFYLFRGWREPSTAAPENA